jgi:hypothetical protein
MRGLVCGAALILLLAACSGSGSDRSGDEAAGGGTPPSSSTACERAWEGFAAIDDLHDTLQDAVPTLLACSDLDEWIRIGNATPGHSLFVGRVTAKNLCRFQQGAQGSKVCESL